MNQMKIHVSQHFGKQMAWDFVDKKPLLERERLVASFIKEVNPRLAKRPLNTNGRLANLGLTYSVRGRWSWVTARSALT